MLHFRGPPYKKTSLGRTALRGELADFLEEKGFSTDESPNSVRSNNSPRNGAGRSTDAQLDLLRRCFLAEEDVVIENGQPFLFRPRPPCPPIFIGGAGEHALQRTIRFGDGWMPMGADPTRLKPDIARLHALAQDAGRPAPEVVCLGALETTDPSRGAAQLNDLAEIGVTRFVLGGRYQSASEFRILVDRLVATRTAG